jgi:hypothetical protein
MDAPARPSERFDTALPLSEVLARVRGELADLTRCADDLQATISAIVDSRAASLPPGAQMQLQAADALSQRLERLARLAALLEAEAAQGWVLAPGPTASDDLHAILARLAAGVAADHDGDCEIF